MLYRTSSVATFISETPDKKDLTLNQYAIRLIKAHKGLNINLD
jgi:hypothetical protein